MKADYLVLKIEVGSDSGKKMHYLKGIRICNSWKGD